MLFIRTPFSIALFRVKTQINKNDWSPVCFVKLDDSLNVIEVHYIKKHEPENVVYCKAVFVNRKTREYKCDAPWAKNFLIQDVIFLESRIVSKTEMK